MHNWFHWNCYLRGLIDFHWCPHITCNISFNDHFDCTCVKIASKAQIEGKEGFHFLIFLWNASFVLFGKS